MQVPSHQIKDTLLRFYEITKIFVYQIKMQMCTIMRQNAASRRFLAKLRTQIIKTINKNTGFTKDYLKVSFLNHSKWNQNKYPNYVEEYAIVNTINEKRKPEFTRSENSQIVWQVELSSILLIRFYYLHKKKQQDNKFDRKIKFTQMVLDFSEAVKQLHQRNSYDYELNYGWNEDYQSPEEKVMNKQLKPTKVNEISLNNEAITSRFPVLKASIRSKQSSQIEWSIVNNKKAQEDYIERSDFNFAQ